MRGWWQDLTDLVLPAECGGCGRSRTVLCPECRAALAGVPPRRVTPVPRPPGLPVVHAAARYGDAVRAMLLAHKERGVLALAAPLGAALAGAVRAGLREAGAGACAGVPAPSPEAARAPGGGQTRRDPAGSFGTGLSAGGELRLVPMPSSPRAVRARGHDPARRIAFAAAGELRRTGTPARVVAVLRQARAVADQSGLNSRERMENLAGALVVAPGAARLLSGGPVVLVDDLMTTGASLTEAARAVRVALAGLGNPGGDAETIVYAAGRREGREEQGQRAPLMRRSAPVERIEEAAGRERGRTRGDSGDAGGGEVCRSGRQDLVRAAVVAATPDPFETNRN
ncbi:ComF family protein [Streptomyces sp. NPDC005574]|uniref:ComF family protein n=1 Tax=Streptomyces sp. NPDC005574 TaxID=3156891 RepID=UPI0033BE3AAA